jgi:hypothetical protein
MFCTARSISGSSTRMPLSRAWVIMARSSISASSTCWRSSSARAAGGLPARGPRRARCDARSTSPAVTSSWLTTAAM